MNQKTLIARLRQILVADKNVFDIYTELAKLTQDHGQRKLFSNIADDEKRHVALGEEMLSLLEK